MDFRAFLIGGLVGAAAIGAVGVVRFGWPDLNSHLNVNAPAVTQTAPTTGPAAPSTASEPAATPNPLRVERGNLVMESIPEIPAAVTDTLLRYQNARSAGFLSFAPAGGILIRTRFGETAQIHRVSMPMGAREQLTFFTEPVGGAAYPRTETAAGFLFSRDTGGDENFQIYFHDDATGADTRISEEGTRNTDWIWSHDGKRVAWARQTKDSPVYTIMVAEIGKPESRRAVFEREGSWSPADFSPDGTKLLLTNYVSVAEGSVHVLDLASGALTQVNPKPEKIAYGGALFAPDGQSIYATTDEGREFQTLMRFPLDGPAPAAVTENIGWDVDFFDIAPGGAYLAFAVNEGGLSRIEIRNLADGSTVPGPQLPPGVIGGMGFSPDGSRLALTFTNAQSAGDVWVYALGASELVRWTQSEIGGLNAAAFVMPELISYPTFDEVGGKPREIPAFYYRPRGEGPLPVIIYIHGGPESQERPDFTATFQYWLNELGVAILAPNVRGSAGYGKSYLALDNGKLREDSVKDIGALLDWIATRPELDAKRVVVYGGSYGGYMVNAALTHYSDKLAGGVSAVGISNFVTFLENTSGYRRDLRRVEYGDERDPAMREFLTAISPSTNAGKITKPIFIIQGANDPRVPLSESEQMLEAVRKNGVSPWYLMAKDEGHGFQKKSNRDFQNAAIVMFLREVLKLSN